MFNDPSTTDGKGLMPLSYWDYLQALVSRYASSPALGMWEPMSEAEASTCPPQYEPINCSGHQTCPDESVASSALRYFFDTVGAESMRSTPGTLWRAAFSAEGSAGLKAPTTSTCQPAPESMCSRITTTTAQPP